jgi:hypothetical protein
MGMLAGQRYSLANNPSWISEYGAWVFWIPTSECSFYHKDRVRRLKACGRLPRGQIPLPLELENTDGEKERA